MRLIARVVFTPVALLSLAVAPAMTQSRGGGGFHAPTMGGAFHTPTMGGAFHTPTTGSAFHTPTTGSAFRTPTTGSGFRTPMMRGGSLGRVTVGGIHLTP
jgi:hypothetical protein